MINNKKLYIIKWIDSYTLGDYWQSIEDLDKPIDHVCISVGWIEKETKNNIVIIPHISDINSKGKGMGCGIMTIPKVSILERIKVNTKKL
jgi:hypothetical protein